MTSPFGPLGGSRGLGGQAFWYWLIPAWLGNYRIHYDMPDPRLVELTFLNDIDKTPGGKSVTVIDGSPRRDCYGLLGHQFKELVLYVIWEELVNGVANIRGNIGDMAGHLKELKGIDVGTVGRGGNITLRMNHKGRLRLWSLRDQLRSDRPLDPFGPVCMCRHM